MSAAYIIDPSVLIQGYINEPASHNVLTLLDQVPDDIELHTSEFCIVECANILWKQVRFNGMPRGSCPPFWARCGGWRGGGRARRR